MAEVERLKQELAEATAAFDELSSSSAQIEKELNEELDAQSKVTQAAKHEAQELRERVAEQGKRLAEALAAGEAARHEVRTAQAALQQAQQARVELETQVAQLDATARAHENASERHKAKYEELLEQSAIEKCQLEDARRELAELKERQKVESMEGAAVVVAAAAAPTVPPAKNDELSVARKEAAFTRTLLRELVAALSRGNVVIPTADDLIAIANNNSVASASGE
jgi:chromosome segregation ATPase